MLKSVQLPVNKESRIALPKRFVIAFLFFLASVVTQSHRLNVSFAIVDMVNVTKRNSVGENGTECSDVRNEADVKYNKNAEFFWDTELQGLILSSTFIGVTVTQFPGGLVSDRLGVKRLVLINLIIGSLCNLLSPIAARTNPYLLFVTHLIKGLAQGFVRSAISLISARWFPKCEKGYLSAFVLSGYATGGFLCSVVSGPVCELEFDNGWPLVFYIFGIFGIFVGLLIVFFYVERPTDHPNISEKELKYVLENTNYTTSTGRPPTPWLAMLTSGPTYALIVSMFGQYWMMYYLLTVHPIYMDAILNIPVKENGLLVSGPQLAQAVAGLIACYFSFWINRNDASKINLARKGCNSIAVVLFLIGLAGIYFSGCNVIWNEFFLFFIAAAPAFGFGGITIAVVDMTPTYCGPLTGLASTIGSLPGFIIPNLTGRLTKYEQTMAQWHKLFLITAVVAATDGVVFLLWGSTKIQPYDPACKQEKSTAPQPQITLYEITTNSKLEVNGSEVTSTHL